MQDFFQEFSFDTLLALISCVTGIVALFLGGSAYKKCKINKNSFNDSKKYGNNCTDNSQKAGRDIVNNNCDVNALTELTRENFQVSLNQAYSFFEQKSADNLHRIIEETNRIIQEGQIKLGSFTTIDWINIYFENAKTTSDEFMQNVWAKVLAKEIETPDSFSFQTLGVLRNMSANDFKLFEIMCSLQVDGRILKTDLCSNYGFDIEKMIRMQELGLLSGLVEDDISIAYNSQMVYNYLNQYVIVLKNYNTGVTLMEKNEGYHLSTSALELLPIVKTQANERYIIDYTIEMANRIHKEIKVSLHELKESEINYSEDLLETRDVCFMSPDRTFIGGKFREELKNK